LELGLRLTRERATNFPRKDNLTPDNEQPVEYRFNKLTKQVEPIEPQDGEPPI
jgi:hypothetical protein